MDKIEAGRIAGEKAREETLRIAQAKGPKPEHVLLRIRQGMGAKMVKVKWVDGAWQYSKRLIDHRTRLVATDMAAKLLDLYPSQKHDVDFTGEINVNIVHFSDRDHGPDGQSPK